MTQKIGECAICGGLEEFAASGWALDPQPCVCVALKRVEARMAATAKRVREAAERLAAERASAAARVREAATQRRPRPVADATTRSSGSRLPVFGLLLGGSLLAWATMNSRDASGRFRDRRGRFTSGRWG